MKHKILLHEIFPNKPNTRMIVRRSYRNLLIAACFTPEEARSSIVKVLDIISEKTTEADSEVVGC